MILENTVTHMIGKELLHELKHKYSHTCTHCQLHKIVFSVLSIHCQLREIVFSILSIQQKNLTRCVSHFVIVLFFMSERQFYLLFSTPSLKIYVVLRFLLVHLFQLSQSMCQYKELCRLA